MTEESAREIRLYAQRSSDRHPTVHREWRPYNPRCGRSRVIQQRVQADSFRNTSLFKLLSATDLSGGIVTNMLVDGSDRAALRGGIVGQNIARSGGSTDDAEDTAFGVAAADLIGLTNLSNATTGSGAVTGQQLSTGQSWGQGLIGAAQMSLPLVGGFSPPPPNWPLPRLRSWDRV